MALALMDLKLMLESNGWTVLDAHEWPTEIVAHDQAYGTRMLLWVTLVGTLPINARYTDPLSQTTYNENPNLCETIFRNPPDARHLAQYARHLPANKS